MEACKHRENGASTAALLSKHAQTGLPSTITFQPAASFKKKCQKRQKKMHNRIFQKVFMCQEVKKSWGIIKKVGSVWLSLGHGGYEMRFLCLDGQLLPGRGGPARLRRHWARQAPVCSCEAAGSVHRGQLEDVSCLYCRAAPLPKSTAQTSQSPGQKKNGIFGRSEIPPLPPPLPSGSYCGEERECLSIAG